jgi:hypothetical protein
MKKLFYTLILVFIIVLNGTGQNILPDKIEAQKVFGGYNFIADGQKLNLRQLEDIMKTYDPAYEEMRSAKTDYNLGVVAGCAGGFMLGWQLGKSISGKQANWEMIALGVGMACISIPLTLRSHKKAVKAVNLYNNRQGNMSRRGFYNPVLNFCYSKGVVGVSLKILM